MAAATFKWNAIKGLATKVIGNKPSERVIVKIFALQDTDSQTWAVVVNSILEEAHIANDDLVDSHLKNRSATLTLQIAQSKISHLIALASKFEAQGKTFKLAITFPTKWKLSFPIFAHRDFVRLATNGQIQEMLEMFVDETKPLAWCPTTKEIWTPQGNKKVKTGALVAIFDKKPPFVDENKPNGEVREDNLCFRWRATPPGSLRMRETRMRRKKLTPQRKQGHNSPPETGVRAAPLTDSSDQQSVKSRQRAGSQPEPISTRANQNNQQEGNSAVHEGSEQFVPRIKLRVSMAEDNPNGRVEVSESPHSSPRTETRDDKLKSKRKAPRRK